MARQIVIGTDGSEAAERALGEAIAAAASDGSTLHVVTAYPDPEIIKERITSGATAARINLREIADGVLARAERTANERGVDVRTYASEQDPAEAILQVAEEQSADLIVVGSRGLSGIRRFLLGSVSSKVSEHAHCSVMIVRA